MAYTCFKLNANEHQTPFHCQEKIIQVQLCKDQCMNEEFSLGSPPGLLAPKTSGPDQN